MQASRCTTACATRLLTLLTASVLLVQCSMPPQQTWHYIQTNGLLTYLGSSRQSPPLRTAGSSSQYYAQRSSPSANGYSGMPHRNYYGSTGTLGYASNSYLAAPSLGAGSSRYVPRSRVRSRSDDRTPSVKIPVEEPSSAPQFAHSTPPANPAPTNSTPVNPTPKSTASDSPATTAAADLPYGSAIPGRMNMVNSPYAGKTQLVDVSGMSAGQTVKCPYTGKLFKVPPTQQAANHAEPRLESKIEAPKTSEEAKTEDKKP